LWLEVRCDPNTHGTFNLLSHLKKYCPKYPRVAINNPNQTTLTFKSGENNNILVTSQKYNVQACLDEQSFRVVEGGGFKNLCKQLQPLCVVLSGSP